MELTVVSYQDSLGRSMDALGWQAKLDAGCNLDDLYEDDEGDEDEEGYEEHDVPYDEMKRKESLRWT
eukprot:1161674-Pelagomonas_calceolata.AAC.2